MAQTTIASNQKAGTDQRIAKKWGATLTSAGWTALPNVIFQRQRALGLSTLDINILLQLTAYWWESSNLPHPSKTTIANAIGVTPRTIQKRIAEMEKAGFIKRVARKSERTGSATNLYDFSGLISSCEPFAQEELNEIESKKLAKTAKFNRKRPQLSVV
jgi:predicted transcriptional regulator